MGDEAEETTILEEGAAEGEAPPAEGEAAAPSAEEPAEGGAEGDAPPAEGDAPPAEEAGAGEAPAEGGEGGDGAGSPEPPEGGGEEGGGDAPLEPPAGDFEGDESPGGLDDGLGVEGDEDLPLGDDGDLDQDGIPSPPPEQDEDGGEPYIGFEDEEEERYDHEDDEGFEEEQMMEEEQGDPLQELKDKFEELIEQNERLQQDNVALQRRVIQWKAQREKYDAAEKPPSEGKVTEHKYLNVLNHVHGVRLRLRMQQVKSARMSDELKNQLEEKRAKAIECRDSFRDFKRQVARHAEYSRTGKRIPPKIIQEVEDFELDKDAEVEEVRGSNISLKNRMAKLEQALRKKDELADNLHVIDFEQLKIENQTLNEKIEERNEELHKLRKKTVITVQVITHMREKLQFIQQENQVLKTELAQLDQELASQRDLVAKTKHERDDYRSENAKLRQATGIVNSEHLTKDYEDRQNLLKRLKEELQTLKSKHKRMMNFIREHSEGAPQPA